MKKLKLPILLLLVSSLLSCKKEVKDDTNDIVGKWQIESYVITNFENTGKDQDDTKGETPRPTFEFKQNGTLNSVFYFHEVIPGKGGKEEKNLNYTLDGNKLILSGSVAFNHDNFLYSISGNILILKRTDVSKIGNINNETHTETTTITLTRLK